MPATFPAKSVSLEIQFFGDLRDEFHVPCDAVTVHTNTITVRGSQAWRLASVGWTPDSLCFHCYEQSHRFPVGRPTIVDDRTARFPLL
jgi:hypothetical protein